MNPFEECIQALSNILGITLQAEQGSRCKLKAEEISVQLDYLEPKKNLVMTSFLAEVPPGTFREEVFIAALKDNAQQGTLGVFAYSDVTGQIALQLFLAISTQPERLAETLKQFIEKAIIWKNAIAGGNLRLVSQSAPSSGPSPLQFMR